MSFNGWVWSLRVFPTSPFRHARFSVADWGRNVRKWPFVSCPVSAGIASSTPPGWGVLENRWINITSQPGAVLTSLGMYVSYICTHRSRSKHFQFSSFIFSMQGSYFFEDVALLYSNFYSIIWLKGPLDHRCMYYLVPEIMNAMAKAQNFASPTLKLFRKYLHLIDPYYVFIGGSNKVHKHWKQHKTK